MIEVSNVKIYYKDEDLSCVESVISDMDADYSSFATKHFNFEKEEK